MHIRRFGIRGARLDLAIRGQRQVHGESRSLSFSFARRLNCSAMHLDQMVHNRQTKSQAGLPPPHLSFSLSEAVKHKREKRRAYSVACVCNCESSQIPCAIEIETDPAPCGCELNGIRQDVPDHLLQAAEVAYYRAYRLIKHGIQMNTLGVDSWSSRFNASSDHRGEIKRS